MDTKSLPRKQRFWIGFAAGLAAGVIASGVMLFVSTTANGISLPEVFGSELTALMPPPLFEYLHQTIGGDAKHYLFYGILVGQSLVFALSGALFNLAVAVDTPKGQDIRRKQKIRKRPGAHKWQDTIKRYQYWQGLVLALILWLFVGLILLPVTGAGIFGAQLAIGPGNTMLSLGEVGVIFGLLFILIRNWLTTQVDNRAEEENTDLVETGKAVSRRTLLKRGVIVAGVGLLGLGMWRFITQGVSTSSVPVARLLQNFKSKIIPPPIPNYGEIHPAPFLSPEVTSNDQYYVVSKNLFADPMVAAGPWRLTVDGEVNNPFTLTYQELLAQPMQQQYESMMCVSNEVGGQYMSNALWEGVPLAYLLQSAGVKSRATKVVFYAADDYSDSIHLDKALEPTTLLAVRMNGALLPQEHGFPARMLVPGIYGMKHCKWLTHIQVVNTNYQGYWQQRGWSDPAPIRMTARIDTPLTGSNARANSTTYIGGVAFSGNRGISEVDVSLDAGQTWQRATLKRPLSGLTWVLWELAWRPHQPGDYTIVARAIDLEGNVQDPNEEPPLPNGSTGYHSIDLTVS